MSPLNLTFTLSPATSSVMVAGNDSVPLMAPVSVALATACSISRCELMPTIFSNLRMLRFSASSFIGIPIRRLRCLPMIADSTCPPAGLRPCAVPAGRLLISVDDLRHGDHDHRGRAGRDGRPSDRRRHRPPEAVHSSEAIRTPPEGGLPNQTG